MAIDTFCIGPIFLQMKVQHSFNEGRPYRRNVPMKSSSSVSDEDKGYRLSERDDSNRNQRNSQLYSYSCAFTRPAKFTENLEYFDLINEQYYLLAAVGKINAFNSG